MHTIAFSQVSLISSSETMASISRQGPFYLRMSQKLQSALRPTVLNLVDESHLHVGHKESPGLPETHFNLEIVAEAFEGLSMLQRHRKVYKILADEIEERVHALSLKTKTPAESGKS